jgi:hypothetical protein
LLDCDWVKADKVAEQWGKLVGQEFGIVKVKDCRQTDYVHEVAKYVVSGSELASWQPEEILEFVHATKGQRFFFAFGSLFKQSQAIRLSLRKDTHRICKCGCDEFHYSTENSELARSTRHLKRPNPSAVFQSRTC